MYSSNNNDKNKDREFILKVIQTAFGILVTLGLLLAGYKVVSIRFVDTIILDFAPPDSQPQGNQDKSSSDSNNGGSYEESPAQIPDPKDFIRYYFDAITSQRNYEYLWSVQTDNFHREASNNSYSDYVTYWNTIDYININSIDLYDQTTYSVRCRVKMSMHKNGQDIPVDVVFYLMYDQSKGSWVFDVP